MDGLSRPTVAGFVTPNLPPYEFGDRRASLSPVSVACISHCVTPEVTRLIITYRNTRGDGVGEDNGCDDGRRRQRPSGPLRKPAPAATMNPGGTWSHLPHSNQPTCRYAHEYEHCHHGNEEGVLNPGFNHRSSHWPQWPYTVDHSVPPAPSQHLPTQRHALRRSLRGC